MIKEWIRNWKEKQRRFSDFQEADTIQRKVEERKLGHNERVLMKILEEERQERIKTQLKLAENRRKAKEKKLQNNMMKFNSNMFKDDVIWTQRNMFK